MNETLHQKVAEVHALLREKLRLRGRTLAAQLRRGGRLLPRDVRRDATYLAQVVPLADHPKLQRLIDPSKVTSAHSSVIKYLEGIDPAVQRRVMFLTVVTGIAFAIFTTGVLVIVVLWWRGFV